MEVIKMGEENMELATGIDGNTRKKTGVFRGV